MSSRKSLSISTSFSFSRRGLHSAPFVSRQLVAEIFKHCNLIFFELQWFPWPAVRDHIIDAQVLAILLRYLAQLLLHRRLVFVIVRNRLTKVTFQRFGKLTDT